MIGRIEMQDIAVRALTDARGAFRDLDALRLSRATLWQVLLLLTIVRVLLMAVLAGGSFLLPLGTAAVPVSAMTYTTVLAAGFVVTVFLIYYTGRAMGGTGTFPGALAASVLIEVLSLMLVALQLVLGLVSSAIAGLAGLAAIPIVVFCSLTYIDELHGFGSLWKAFGMVLLAVLGLSLGITLLVSLIGVGVTV